MPMRARLESEINRVHTGILQMGTHAEEALHMAMQALSTDNLELAQNILLNDKKIDRMQAEIDDLVMQIIAMEQPVASDLRGLIAGIKIVAEIERIGDHARHIASTTAKISREALEPLLPRITAMNNTGISMLHDAMTAFMNTDDQMAETIARRDDKIDELYDLSYQEILSLMQSSTKRIPDGAILLMVCRYLERLGDHVTNICEWVVYAGRCEHIELNE